MSVRTVALLETDWAANVNSITSVHWSYDLSQYIIGGDDGKIATSATGESWEYQSGLKDIGWPNGTSVKQITKIPGKKYLAVGDNGHVAISDTGVVWTDLDSIGNTVWGTTNVNAAASNGSMYMIVGDNSLVATSIDGITWTLHKIGRAHV